MDLKKLGWNSYYEESFAKYKSMGYKKGRIISEHKHLYWIATEDGELLGEVTGKLRYMAMGPQDFPAVGDWVAFSPLPGEKKAIIQHVLPRKSKFSRNVAGKKTEEQVLAANIDLVFQINALNNDFNPRRIERYLTLIWDSGADPVIILNKADLCTDIDSKMAEIKQISMGVPVYVISCKTGKGLEELNQYFKEGKTAVFLGSSGVGKSTLINKLKGSKVQKTKESRHGDDRGRHTTTHRELIMLSEGMVIDTPGLREIQLWDGQEGISGTFNDIEELAKNCKFNDCQHKQEPDCAVKEAIEEGRLDPDRLKNYRKIQRELAYNELKKKRNASYAERMKWKEIMGN